MRVQALFFALGMILLDGVACKRHTYPTPSCKTFVFNRVVLSLGMDGDSLLLHQPEIRSMAFANEVLNLTDSFFYVGCSAPQEVSDLILPDYVYISLKAASFNQSKVQQIAFYLSFQERDDRMPLLSEMKKSIWDYSTYFSILSEVDTHTLVLNKRYWKKDKCLEYELRCDENGCTLEIKIE
jgi:hypothetical protein